MKVTPSKSVNDPPTARAPHEHIICPYCGHAQAPADDCASCRGLFEPLSKQATQNAMGPWRIRDEASPFRPPCSYQTLQSLIKRARIGPDSVISGPTTRQFWARAADTPGVAHLLGQCHHCHTAADPSDALCTDCGASFLVDEDRNFLGLSPVRPLGPQAQPPAPRPTPPLRVDPFAGPPADAPPAAPPRRHSRMPMVILLVALAVALVAIVSAALRAATPGAAPAGSVPDPAATSSPDDK